LQPLGVILELCGLNHLHSALNTPLKCSLLVFAEIVPGARAQQVEDRGQRVSAMLGIEWAPSTW